MPKYIIKLVDGDKDYYLEWSTIVDAPVTYGMSLEEFKKYYEAEYGRQGMEELPQRLARVEKTGASSRMDEAVDEVITRNRAGPNERCISKKEIIQRYCRTTSGGGIR